MFHLGVEISSAYLEAEEGCEWCSLFLELEGYHHIHEDEQKGESEFFLFSLQFKFMMKDRYLLAT